MGNSIAWFSKKLEKIADAIPIKTKNVNIFKTKKDIDTIFCMENVNIRNKILRQKQLL